MNSLRVGVVGAGNISGTYLTNLRRFGVTEVIALADVDSSRAEEVAAQHGVPLVLSTEDLLAHPEVDIVLNLTSPFAHAEIAFAAVAAEKHVYNEKPLAVEYGEGRSLLAEAERQGVRVGGAPDTFMGAGQQACRAIVDSGRLGQVVGIQGTMVSGGSESWHPDPRFHYGRGGGPLFVMGPYYLTAFVNLLGPIKRVSGFAKIVKHERLITSEPRRGETIQVETPTNIMALFEFASGAIGELTTSYDVPVPLLPNLVVNGTLGTLKAPDPNHFSGDVTSCVIDEKAWQVHPIDLPYAVESRGIGLIDMALAIAEERPHRASGALALHVLEAMHAVLRSAQSGRHIVLETTVERPHPMPETPLF